MAGYHRYVFDTKKRKLVGAFEQMYRDEGKKGFDSWHQDDTRHLQRRIALSILQDYNFDLVVDLGCGKGAFTHLLKRKNNRVLAVDGSTTALRTAKTRYPDIDFVRANLNNPDRLRELFRSTGKRISLVFSFELLSYLSRWKDVLHVIGKQAEYVLIGLFIPENPIGFVKSEQDLVDEIERHFEVVEWISLRKSGAVVVFGRRRARK